MTEGNPGCVLRFGLSAATAAYRLHCKTLRTNVLLGDGSVIKPQHFVFDSEIFALCEADALALGGFLADRGFIVLVTVGKDGDRAAVVLKKLGCTVVRGSSRRKGAGALRKLVRHLELSPAPAAIVVDGPLGPAGIAKGGAIACAMVTGRRLCALTASASRSFRFPNTWSGIYLPLPFSRLAVVCDAPLPLPKGTGFEEADDHCTLLTDRFRLIRTHSQHGIIRPPKG